MLLLKLNSGILLILLQYLTKKENKLLKFDKINFFIKTLLSFYFLDIMYLLNNMPLNHYKVKI